MTPLSSSSTPEPTPPAASPAPVPVPQVEQPGAPASLMKIVIVVLGIALLALVGAYIALALQKKTIPSELNTLASLIAGGLIGFLSPHVAKMLPQKPADPKAE